MAISKITNSGIGTIDTLAVDTDTLYVDSTNNRVGMGQTTPTSRLHIKPSVDSSEGGIALESQDGTHKWTIDANNGGNLRFYKGATAVGRFDSSGNLLVGTTSASGFDTGADNFVVGSGAENAGMTIYSGTTNTGTINFADGTSGSAIYAGGINYNHSTNTMAFYTTDGSGRMYIDSSGNLLLGKSSGISDSYLQIAGSSSASSIRLENSYASGTAILINNQSNASFNALYFENGGANRGSIVVGTSSTAYNTTSDYRLKENVTADWDATTRLKQLNPVRFNFIADADTTVDGFLAHEVQDIVPEAITGTKDAMRDEEYEVTPAVLDEDGNEVTPAVMGTRSVPDYQGIDQSKLVPLLVKTIQELEARIAALENA